MIRFRESDWRQEAAEGVLYFRVSDACQRLQRMNENMLEAAVHLLLLEGDWQLVTRSSVGAKVHVKPT